MYRGGHGVDDRSTRRAAQREERLVKPAASRSFRPRLSEACRLLPLIRGHVAAAAPSSLACAVELVPIVEDGLFGYEFVCDRDVHVCPIIGCNAQGEPVLRKNWYGVGAPDALRLVAVNGRLLSRSGRAARPSIRQSDSLFPDWLAAAEAAWAQLLPLASDLPGRTPVSTDAANRSLDKALHAAHAHLLRWDPFIEFFGLPNEAHLGFALSGGTGEHGELLLRQRDTWALRWNAPPDVVCESWSVLADDRDAGIDTAEGALRSRDRRARCRRATDRGRSADSWAGGERRRGRERRAADRHGF